MTNLIPTGPSQRDIQEMSRLKSIMEGNTLPAVSQPIQGHYGNSRTTLNETRVAPPIYTPSFGPGREDVDAMKNILQKLQSLGGDETPAAPPQRTPMYESVESTNFSTPTSSHVSSGPFTVLVQIAESNGKEVNRYSVVDGSRRDVFSELVMKESATALMKLLNRGESTASNKCREILDLEEEYNRNRIEMGRHKQRHARSTQLGETAAANVFKDRFNTAKANAMVAQDTIKSINESIR